MKILVIGSGGREHALVWKLAQSENTTQLWCAPGNAGTAMEVLTRTGQVVENCPVGAEDLEGLLALAREKKPDLVVVGPDNPLSAGIVDLFQAQGLTIWGPNQKAAQFEASKAFSQRFMDQYGIPTAKSGVFDDADKAMDFAASLHGRCAVKADGLALGKGVLITEDLEQARQAIKQVMVDKAFGEAGKQVVIQEKLEGIEVSMHALCDGARYLLFDTSQDHKRALDGDQGLNTGGMGTYSPAPFLSADQIRLVKEEILDRWVKGCMAESIDFRGMLYPGLMMTSDGIKVLEFNARFGDPETQVYLMRLKNDLPSLLMASATGSLEGQTLEWADQAATCVVMASGGYPESYPKGIEIKGLKDVEAMSGVKVFHAGTQLSDTGACVTSGGRVLGVTALGNNLTEATAAAYRAVEAIDFTGCHFRRDIAAKAL